MKNTIDGLLALPGTTIAVVGATDSAGKYGGIVYRDLKAKGFDVIAVNPRRETVDGDPAHPSVADLRRRPRLVVIVVPPDQTLGVLQTCRGAGLTTVWLQPGAEDPAVLEYLADHGFEARVRDCIMVRTRTADRPGARYPAISRKRAWKKRSSDGS